MAKYYQQKFEDGNGREVVVCWRQDKHVHNAGIISVIQKWLATQQGGTWTVRSNSYKPASSCGKDALFFDGK